MDDRIIGFAIVGLGNIGTFHAEQIKKLRKGKLVAVCDNDIAKAEKFASKYICKTYSNLNDMLQNKEVDVVSICTPSFLHGSQTIQCVRAGKHVITEKPMAIDLPQADSMINESRKAGVKLAIISQHRMNPDIVKVKNWINNGQFGQLVMGTSSVNWYRSQQYYDSSTWRGTWKGDGGGVLMNQGIHTIDLLQYLMGPVKSVFAYCRTLGHVRIEVEDAAIATLEFENGAIGSIVSTTCAYPGLSTRIEIFGQLGSAIIENNKLIFTKFMKQNKTERLDITDDAAIDKSEFSILSGDPLDSIGETHILQFEDMVEAIENDREPIINGAEGRKPLEIIQSIYQSAGIGKKVELSISS